MEESLIKCLGDRWLAIRGVSASLTAYSSLNKPTDHSSQQDVPKEHFALKNKLQRFLFAFSMSLSIIFWVLHYFLHGFIVSSLGSVILLAFRVHSLTSYEQSASCRRKLSLRSDIRYSRLHCQSASQQETGTEESFGDLTFLYCSTLQILN